MKRLPLIFLFLLGTPLLLLASLQMTRLPSSSILKAASDYLSPEGQILGTRVFAALPEPAGSFDFRVQADDARSLILSQYLQTFNSPLLDYTDQIIAASDAYHIDFRLLVAIARQESNLCAYIPDQSNNCWGWGIHERGSLSFDSYQQAIWTIARGLRTDYLDQGLTTPEQIMTRYTPRSDGSWAAAVSQFLQEME